MHITSLIMVLLTVVEARKLTRNFLRTSQYETREDNNQESNQEQLQLPVDFKYLSREGVGDTDLKQPFDSLVFRIMEPRYVDHAMQRSPKNLLQMPKREPALKFHSPTDEMEYYKNDFNVTAKNKDSRPFDFSSILERNLADPFASRRGKAIKTQNTRKFPKLDRNLPRKLENITDYFEDNRFYRKPNRNIPKINWTTCGEFAKNAVFHPGDIVNTKWLPFFIWSKRQFSRTVTHVFSYPTKKQVQYYKTTFGLHYKNIDWKQPKLLLTERRNMLLIAGDRKGLFYGIPDQELPKDPSIKDVFIPAVTLRLKLHDPYLAMMLCDDVYYAAIMAELGTEPNSEREALLEASTLNFKGIGTTARRDLQEENFIANYKQNKKMEDEAKKFIPVYKSTRDMDITDML